LHKLRGWAGQEQVGYYQVNGQVGIHEKESDHGTRVVSWEEMNLERNEMLGEVEGEASLENWLS